MKKILFISLFVPLAVFAQQRKIVSTPTVAYSDESGAKAVGIFMRGAIISNYEIMKNYNYKVYTDYTQPLYIRDTYNLKDRLKSDDEIGKTPSAIINEDDYYVGPHLFTNVASLKVKAQPNIEAAVLGKLLNGTVIPIEYYPYTQDSWIPVDYEGKRGYISSQFIGKRPVLKDLYFAYQNSTTAEDMKKYAERILELGWNSSASENAEALDIYAYYANFSENYNVAKLCKLQAEVLRNIDKGFDHFLVEDLINNKEFGFTLNNNLEPKNGFSVSYLQKNLGNITKSHTDLDDCALGDYENNVYFTNAECISHDIKKTYILRKLKMDQSQGFKIYDQFLNANTTEEEFLVLTKKLINHINGKTSSYLIGTDAYYYEFQFTNGKLAQVVINYYC